MNNDAFLSLFLQPPVREIVTDDEDAVLDGDFGLAQREAASTACGGDAAYASEDRAGAGNPACGNSMGGAASASPIGAKCEACAGDEPRIRASAAQARGDMAGLMDEPDIDGPLSMEADGDLGAPVDSCADWDEEMYLDGAFGAPDAQDQTDWGGRPSAAPAPARAEEPRSPEGANDGVAGSSGALEAGAPGASREPSAHRQSEAGALSPQADSDAAGSPSDDLEMWLDAQPLETPGVKPENAPTSLTTAANRVLLADLGEANAASIEASLDEWGLLPKPPIRVTAQSTPIPESTPPETRGEGEAEKPAAAMDTYAKPASIPTIPEVTYDWAVSVGDRASGDASIAVSTAAGPAISAGTPENAPPDAPPPESSARLADVSPHRTWIHLESVPSDSPDEAYLDGAVGAFTPFEALLDGAYEPVLGAEDIDVTMEGKGDHAWRNTR